MSQFNDHMNKKAVALSYDEDVNAAPVVVASGSGYIAQKIVETARNNGIPVYEDNSLATMLSQLELGSEIPEQLYQAIVEIYVYFLNFAPNGTRTSSRQQEGTAAGQADDAGQMDGEGRRSSDAENAAANGAADSRPGSSADAAAGAASGIQGLSTLSDTPLANPLPGNQDATTAARLADAGIQILR